MGNPEQFTSHDQPQQQPEPAPEPLPSPAPASPVTEVFIARPGVARADLAHLPYQERRRILNREAAKRWREAHPEQYKERRRQDYERHQDQRQAYGRDYYRRKRASSHTIQQQDHEPEPQAPDQA